MRASIKQSYGASGEQSRAVEGGLPADVVEFSLETDMTRLVDADMVDADWNANEYKGMITESVQWCSSCARATRRRSRAGTTSSRVTSTS